MISKYEIENWFTYHDDPNKVPKYKAIREAAKYLAQVIVDNAPECADTTAAIRKLRESVMTANAAIACAPPMGLGLSNGDTVGVASEQLKYQAQAAMKETEEVSPEVRKIARQIAREMRNS